jgi:hypothetical protein
MTTLTVYSSNFDKGEAIVNNGMSGKVYLDMDNMLGMQFKDMDEALEYIVNTNLPIQRIEFNYVDKDGIQMFKRFMVDQG